MSGILVLAALGSLCLMDRRHGTVRHMNNTTEGRSYATKFPMKGAQGANQTAQTAAR